MEALSRLGPTKSLLDLCGRIWPELVVAASRALRDCHAIIPPSGSRGLLCYQPPRRLLMLEANLKMPPEVHEVMKKESVDGELYLTKSYPE